MDAPSANIESRYLFNVSEKLIGCFLIMMRPVSILKLYEYMLTYVKCHPLPLSIVSCSFLNGWMWIFGRYLCIECRQICPCMMEVRLLVSFNLSKEITFWPFECHAWPLDGESPCKKVFGFGGGSPAPATIHWELNKVAFDFILLVL